MSTVYPADPCAPPQQIHETIRERLQCVLMRRALPWLVKTEMSPSTCAELREIIRQIEGMTANAPRPVNYQPDDYDRVSRDEFMQGEML